MTARAASTYRAARRNQFAHAPFEWGSRRYFAGSHKAQPHRGIVRYVPYETKQTRHARRRAMRVASNLARSTIVGVMQAVMS